MLHLMPNATPCIVRLLRARPAVSICIGLLIPPKIKIHLEDPLSTVAMPLGYDSKTRLLLSDESKRQSSPFPGCTAADLMFH